MKKDIFLHFTRSRSSVANCHIITSFSSNTNNCSYYCTNTGNNEIDSIYVLNNNGFTKQCIIKESLNIIEAISRTFSCQLVISGYDIDNIVFGENNTIQYADVILIMR